ncbi:Crp/Fnr family transcriptional regulator [Candidatus Marinarcus aquaticus]|uniref:Crp/Fnr family transcriptional regulator n=1 Tax=Candidatus Marinarcus aquaticus TaxID=2044504 RepID=A0A4Q0XT72_9BACT|nr:Crp/Fnr family transcriptional regulator [Candidatus Marinarcus aquaticus]RXJ57611.1 Crp/Fnr family transcriptional regulator [Candidatus Marinarcus aquaticus]
MFEDLKSIFLFADLDESVVKEIAQFSIKTKYNKEYILFYEGDESNSLYILNKGIVKLYKTASNGKELVLKYFQDNELIAEAASFQGIPYPATAEAFTDVEVIKIDFKKLKEVMLSNAELCFNMQISLIKKIKNLEGIIATNMVLDTKEKVAKYICDHKNQFFKTKNIHIAQMLNITPETLSRTLKVFKDEGLIDPQKKRIDTEGLSGYFL